MITQFVFTNLDEYIVLLQRFNNNLRVILTFHFSVICSDSSFSTEQAQSQFLSYINSLTSVCTSSISVFITAADSALNHSAQNLDFMSMNLLNTHKGSVPSEEKLWHRALNLCNYCKSNSHQTLICLIFKCYNCEEIEHSAQGYTKSRKQQLQKFSLIDVSVFEKQRKD